MLIGKRKGWELPDSAATPEHLFHQRRRLLQGLAAGPILLAGGGLGWRAAAEDADPTADLYPVPRNPRYQLDQRIPEISGENLVTTYNNFYEFGSHKQIWKSAQALKRRPWTVTLDGMVQREQILDIDDLLRQCRSRNVSTGIAASRRGRWPCHGAAFRCAALVDLARRSAAPNRCAWKPSSTPRWRSARGSSGIPGRMSRG